MNHHQKPTPSLLLLFSLSTLLSCSFASLRCPPCGSIRIPYPLSTAPVCGDQAYKLRCTAATGELYLDALNMSSYLVSAILAETQRIILRPAPMVPNACFASDITSHGIQLDPNLPFNITSSNTVLLLNCTEAMLNLQAPINCSSNSLCHTYIDATPSASQCKRESICCMFRTGGSQTSYIIRVHEGGCSAYQSFVDLDTSLPVGKWPQPGVELEWASPKEPVCLSEVDCKELRNSNCSPGHAGDEVRRCLCRTGWRWDAIHGLCQKCRPGMGCKIKRNHTPLVGSVGSALILCTGVLLIYRQRVYKKKLAKKILVREREEILNANNNGKSAKIFTGKELKKATNNFSKDNLLGSGAFGDVYKGILPDGTITAVKRAKSNNTKGTSQVLNEVRILCQVNHRSLVRLLGCSVDLQQPLLVYEYVSNGTLFEHLHGNRHRRLCLNWHRRLMIALQTAEGLSYLHSSAVPPIYHRDVKSSNILLNANLDVKVSDFGLSRLVEPSEGNFTHICTGAQGTVGYLDPEYYLNLQLTDRSDVYSFGVVLMELLTSKKAIDFNREEEDVNLVVYMKRVIDEERLTDVIDPALKEGANEVELDTMKALGYLAASCIEERRQNRPSMKEVAEEIEYLIAIATGKATNEGFVVQTTSKKLEDSIVS